MENQTICGMLCSFLILLATFGKCQQAPVPSLITCNTGTLEKTLATNGSTVNIDKGGLQRLQCEVDRTMFSTMVYNFSDLDMSFKDHFKSRKGGTVTHVLYLNVTGSGWLVISGLNVTSQNTDYHHMLYFHVMEENPTATTSENSTGTSATFDSNKGDKAAVTGLSTVLVLVIVIALAVTILAICLTIYYRSKYLSKKQGEHNTSTQKFEA